MKNWSTGAWTWSRDLHFKFRTPNISGKADDTNFEFCMQIDRK